MGKPGHTYPLHGASAAVSCMHALIWHRRVAQSTVRPARAVLSLAGHSKTTVGRLLRACPCRKAPIGIEHALCLTVPLTRILTLRARFVLVCLQLCVYIPSNLHLSANSRGLCIAQRISFTSCAELSSEGLTMGSMPTPCQQNLIPKRSNSFSPLQGSNLLLPSSHP